VTTSARRDYAAKDVDSTVERASLRPPADDDAYADERASSERQLRRQRASPERQLRRRRRRLDRRPSKSATGQRPLRRRQSKQATEEDRVVRGLWSVVRATSTHLRLYTTALLRRRRRRLCSLRTSSRRRLRVTAVFADSLTIYSPQ